jgi:hypothetical protein
MGGFNAHVGDIIIHGQNIDEDRIKRVNADIRNISSNATQQR